MTAEHNELQMKFSSMVEEYENSNKYPDSPDLDGLASEIAAMRNDADLDIFMIYDDVIDLVHVHCYENDEDSPDGLSFDCYLYSINGHPYSIHGHQKTGIHIFDGGCFWGYVDAVAAAQDVIGLPNVHTKPQMYRPWSSEEFDLVDTFIDIAEHPTWTADPDMFRDAIRKMNQYEGDYLSDVKWEEMK